LTAASGDDGSAPFLAAGFSLMISVAQLWIPFVVLASIGQVLRNAMQRGLTASLGTVGATHIRFLFGFPFSLIFLAVVLAATHDAIPTPLFTFWPWLVVGTMAQIVGTALMLAAMNLRSFVIATAYTKTEPIQAAVFGFVFLADQLTLPKTLAIIIATAGVVVTAIKPGGEKGFGDLKPTLLGLGAAAAFALSAVGYRGAILNVHGTTFVTAASFTLALGLFLQTVTLTSYLLAFDRKALFAIFRLWKPSMLAGFMGAFASQFWFLAFALTAVANVRTLALIEVLFAQGISHYSFKQKATVQEIAGIALIVVGVGLLVAVQ
jgi:drug/metabolite transporter (DMT)-like permease